MKKELIERWGGIEGIVGSRVRKGSAAIALTACFAAGADVHKIHLVPPASNMVQEGFVRVINLSANSTDVTVSGIDDAGNAAAGDITFTLDPFAAQQFNSTDIESGNTSKGLTGSFGDGDGNWQLTISADEALKTMGFIRTVEGFMTSMHSIAPSTDGLDHEIDVFNPGSNQSQVSRLRISNQANASSTVTIEGFDDAGNQGNTVTLTLDALASIEVFASELENGSEAKGLTGALGDGQGKWRLQVTTSQEAVVISLLEAPGGYLSNLSPSQTGEAAEEPVATVLLSTIQNTIFSPNCATSGCHSSASSAQMLSLDVGDTFSNTVNRLSSQSTIDLVEPGDPDNSWLVRKVENTQNVGGRMPSGAGPLSQSQIDSIRTWISEGAMDN